MPRKETIGFYTDDKGRVRPITAQSKRGYHSKQKRIVRKKISSQKLEERLRTSKKIKDIVENPKYESFVKQLGTAVEDPKVRLVLAKGLEDGMLTDDIVKTKDITTKSGSLQPIQREIDLANSLDWIGKNPENIPLALRGGTFGPEHFAGKPLVTSKGKYVVDGHHRWSQVYMVNPEAKVRSVDLNIENPKNALLASQLSIAAITGKVEVQKVAKGLNIYDMSAGDIEKNMTKYFTPKFYQAFYGTQPKKFKTKGDVHDHILKNILQMRIERKPATTISRSVMPQYDDAKVTVAADKLAKGEINIKEPFVKGEPKK